MVFGIDGVTTCVLTSPIPSTPMFMIIDTAVGGDGGGQIVNSTLPQTTQVDYVRVFANDPPPTTTVVLPSNNASLTGTQYLDATASPGVTTVNYELSGGPAHLSDDDIASGTSSLFGWQATWNTTDVANGTYTLQSVAATGGASASSTPITVVVDNPPPMTTTVVLPSNNASLSGNQYLDATASTGVKKVNYELSGGPAHLSDDVVATGTSSLFGWQATWNTTGVANGTYTLQSVANAGGVSRSSTPITVVVDNPPPTTTVVLPSNKASLSGNQYLDATASPGVTKVNYELSGGKKHLSDFVVATGTSTLYGWLAAWNTTGIANGTYTLQSVASYGGGVSGTSAPITITVSN
jgi:hypothetical protein